MSELEILENKIAEQYGRSYTGISGNWRVTRFCYNNILKLISYIKEGKNLDELIPYNGGWRTQKEIDEINKETQF